MVIRVNKTKSADAYLRIYFLLLSVWVREWATVRITVSVVIRVRVRVDSR